jgi:hypothetical protein
VDQRCGASTLLKQGICLLPAELRIGANAGSGIRGADSAVNMDRKDRSPTVGETVSSADRR